MPTHPLWRPFEIPSDEEIAAARVNAPQRGIPVEVVEPDPAWPQVYGELAARVRAALGDRVIQIEHVGSTAVPGLAAKPVIDIDLTVADSADEAAYVPALEADGWVLRIREPDWEEHRLLRLEEPECNLHVWSPGSAEPRRHRMFRDWLRGHEDDRARYAAAKRAAAAEGFTDGMHYNNHKSPVVYDLYERIFAADPDHPHDPRPRG
ncbi:GrpB family protein [Nocardioides mangrovi]|uniref:GrpB family protein n=1 Tax=Nocardioides mangrovi TaxID=2874580 RepID=A0ABS7UDD1_9ACTN|nr:GrpB family protein [Nocardioides mangrovi]MBZ5738854.1 GrpB family protein [Nocardioides mangrovi]